MTEQYIFRKKRSEDFTILPNELIQDKNLTWEARGLLIFLLSQKETWKVRKNHLESQSPAGEHVIARLLKELEEKGYMKRKKVRNDKGQFEWITYVYDEPKSTIPQRTTDGSATDGKPPHIESTKLTSTNTAKAEKAEKALEQENEDAIAAVREASYKPKKPVTYESDAGKRFSPHWLPTELRDGDAYDMWVEWCKLALRTVPRNTLKKGDVWWAEQLVEVRADGFQAKHMRWARENIKHDEYHFVSGPKSVAPWLKKAGAAKQDTPYTEGTRFAA